MIEYSFIFQRNHRSAFRCQTRQNQRINLFIYFLVPTKYLYKNRSRGKYRLEFEVNLRNTPLPLVLNSSKFVHTERLSARSNAVNANCPS